MNTNARSLINKFSDFVSLTTTYSPHIVGVTETWLHDEICDSEISPPGFNVVRSDRKDGRRGGGVALFLRSDLNFSVLEGPRELETVWCKVNLHKKTLLIGVFYRPPGSAATDLHTLSNFMNAHNASSANVILMGDFNAPGITWPSLSVSGHNVLLCKELVDLSLSFGIKQIVDCSTRGAAVLDLVFVSACFPDDQYECEVVDGLSDHKAVLVSISLSVPASNYIYTTFHDFNRADDDSITDVLCNSFEQFEQLNASCDVNALVSFFQDIVLRCIRSFVPLKTKKQNPTVPWMTRELLHMSRRISRLTPKACG